MGESRFYVLGAVVVLQERRKGRMWGAGEGAGAPGPAPPPSRLPALLHEPPRARSPCRSGGSREWGGAGRDEAAGDRRRLRACRRSYMNRHSSAAPCRSGGSRECGGAGGDEAAGDRRCLRACRRSYMNRHAPAAPVGAAAAANGAVQGVTRPRVFRRGRGGGWFRRGSRGRARPCRLRPHAPGVR